MLTKKQIDDLSKGEYSNLRLAALFPNHGLAKDKNTLIRGDIKTTKSRLVTLTVNRYGKVTNNFKDFHHQQTMLLSRKEINKIV